MPSLSTFARRTGLPKQRRWADVYKQVQGAQGQAAPEADQEAPKQWVPDWVMDEIKDIFWNPDILQERGFMDCLRKVRDWFDRVPETNKYAADTILEKRLRPSFQLPPAPKPSLIPDASQISADLQKRVVAEGVSVMGSAEQQGTHIRAVLNASHFSNDPGSWSIGVENSPEYRAVPRALLVEILDAYPRAGQANTATEAVIDTLSWLYAHGVTAAGQIDGRGRYVFVIVRNDDGQWDVVCYDPHNYKRILDPNFSATPEEVHSGKYNGYREGPYDTKYGSVII